MRDGTPFLEISMLPDLLNNSNRQSMAAYDGIMPTYHIELMDDRPMLVWNLNSLLQGIQLMVYKMLTDDSNPVKMCSGCGKAFIAKKPMELFCSSSCKTSK